MCWFFLTSGELSAFCMCVWLSADSFVFILFQNLELLPVKQSTFLLHGTQSAKRKKEKERKKERNLEPLLSFVSEDYQWKSVNGSRLWLATVQTEAWITPALSAGSLSHQKVSNSANAANNSKVQPMFVSSFAQDATLRTRLSWVRDGDVYIYRYIYLNVYFSVWSGCLDPRVGFESWSLFLTSLSLPLYWRWYFCNLAMHILLAWICHKGSVQLSK